MRTGLDSDTFKGFTICKMNNDLAIFYQINSALYTSYINENSNSII